ncbi:hypothetical protein ACEPPN_000629 [Leptodophora sp. 'Broadleaf-Isolate-01']
MLRQNTWGGREPLKTPFPKKKKEAKKAPKAAPALKRAATATPVARARAPRVKGDKRLVATLLNDVGEKELERLRAPVLAARKGQVITSRVAGGVTGSTSRALSAASAALYVDSSSKSEGSKETPLGVSLASLITPAAASLATLAATAPTTAISGASGAAVAAAGVSVNLTTF